MNRAIGGTNLVQGGRTGAEQFGGSRIGSLLGNGNFSNTTMPFGNFVGGLTTNNEGQQKLGGAFAEGGLKGLGIGQEIGKIGGPIGAGIGAAVGFIGGGIAKLFMQKKENERLRIEKEQRDKEEKQMQMYNNLNYSKGVLSTYNTNGIQDSNYYKFGGSLSDKMQTLSGGELTKINPNLIKAEGNTHENGGIKIMTKNGKKEIEDKETISKLSTGEQVIFSARLQTEQGISFAKKNELLQGEKNRELKKVKKDNFAINNIDEKINTLFQQQQQIKESIEKQTNPKEEIQEPLQQEQSEQFGLGGLFDDNQKYRDLMESYTYINQQYPNVRLNKIPIDEQNKFSNQFINFFNSDEYKNSPNSKNILEQLQSNNNWSSTPYKGQDNTWESLQQQNLQGGWGNMTENMYNLFGGLKNELSQQSLPTEQIPLKSYEKPNVIVPLMASKINIGGNTRENLNSKIQSDFSKNDNYKGNLNLSGIANNIIPYLDNIVNAKLTKNTPQIPIPKLVNSARLKTDYNINPQLSNINTQTKALFKDLNNNISDSNVTTNSKIAALSNNIRSANDLYGVKENTETQLKNQQALNNQNVEQNNNVLVNDYYTKKMLRQNDIQSRISNNVTDGINDSQFATAQNNQKELDYQRLELSNIMYSGNTAALRKTLPMQIKLAKTNKTYYDTLKTQIYKTNNKELIKEFDNLMK